MSLNFYLPGRKHGNTAVHSMELYRSILQAKLGEHFIIATPTKIVRVTVTEIQEVE